MNVLSVFDGMSCGQIALERAEVKVDNYFASEIDKYAMKVTQNNYPNTQQLGSIIDLKANSLSKIDLFIGGSPCQGFSFAGKQLNFDDPRSKLFFEFVRMLNEIRETNPNVLFLLENVRMKKESQDVITEYLGVEPIEVNSNLVSAQNRKRLYWTNIEGFVQPEDDGVTIEDIIDLDYIPKRWENHAIENMKNIDAEFVNKNNLFFVKGDLISRKSPRRQYGMSLDKCFTLRCAQKHGVYINGNVRFLNRKEYERLQTIPEGYTDCVSENQAMNMLANGWTVDVIAEIFKHIKLAKRK